MNTWIIAFNKDGNTAILKHESENRPDLEQAVHLVMEKAEREYEVQDLDMGYTPEEEEAPAVRLAERYGITVTGISQL